MSGNGRPGTPNEPVMDFSFDEKFPLLKLESNPPHMTTKPTGMCVVGIHEVGKAGIKYLQRIFCSFLIKIINY